MVALVTEQAEKPKPTSQKTPTALAALDEALEVHAVGVPVSKEEFKDRKATGGELLFDRVVYTGIGFGVNEGASLWITDQFQHGTPKKWLGGKAFSKEGFEAATQWISRTFKMPHAKAGNSLLMATLLSGGTLLVLPMRYLEENKITWVRRGNHMLDWMKGNKLTAEEVKARDDDAAKAIACSPQQTWTALVVGRVTAMFSSWATGTFLVKKSGNDVIQDFSQKHLTTAAKAIGFKNADKSDTFNRYARLTGIETYSCLISSAVLEIVSKMFAKRGTEVHDPEICTTAHAAPVNSSTTTNSEPTDAQPTDTKLRADQFKKAPLTQNPKLTPSSYAEKMQVQKENAETVLSA